MANRVRPGIEQARHVLWTSMSASRIGPRSAEPIKASGDVSRSNRPDTGVLLTNIQTSLNPCNAGAIHTEHMVYTFGIWGRSPDALE